MKDRKTISVSQDTYDKLEIIQKEIGQKFGFAPTITQVIDMLIKTFNEGENGDE